MESGAPESLHLHRDRSRSPSSPVMKSSAKSTESGPIPGLHRPFDATPPPPTTQGPHRRHDGAMPPLPPHMAAPHHIAFPGMVSDAGRSSPESPDLPLDVEYSEDHGSPRDERHMKDLDGSDKCEYTLNCPSFKILMSWCQIGHLKLKHD